MALGALIYAVIEYRLHKKERKAEILSNYNSRYSTEEYIKRVIKFLHKNHGIGEKEVEEIKEIFNKNKKLSLNDLEMFMRFFEELQYSIEQKGLSKEITFDMFSFYALEAKPLLEACIEDYQNENWERFRNFVKNMECIKKERNIK